MRSMFFKRSRCRGEEKTAMEEAEEPTLGGPPQLSCAPPPPCTWPPGGARADSAACRRGREAAAPSPWRQSPWRDLHPRLHGNGPEPGNGRPASRNPSPEAAPGVCWGRGHTEEGAQPLSPHPSSCPPPPFAHDRWKDRQTDTPQHSTCITYCPRWVPLVDGVLEVGPQLVKGYNLGKGCVLVRVGAAAYDPSPFLCDIGFHIWGSDQMELAAKVEKLRPREGRGLAQGHTTVWNVTLVC